MARARANDAEKFRAREREAARRRKWSPRSEARYLLNLAVKRGEILRPARCTRCGEARKLQAHHSDYNRPLFVEWLCSLCHGQEHRKK